MKHDSPPLLGPGRHRLTLEGLRALCVVQGGSIDRFTIFIALNALIKSLQRLLIPCEIWVDGSFVTEKYSPADVDISIMIESEAFDRLSLEAKEFVSEIAHADAKFQGYVDAYVCIVFPKGSVERGLDSPEDYARLWGVEHSERHLKGFIVLEMPDAVR